MEKETGAKNAGLTTSVVDIFSPADGGRAEAYGDRGVYVPPGMTAAEIFEGAKALINALDNVGIDMDIYTAQSAVTAVLKKIRSPEISGHRKP